MAKKDVKRFILSDETVENSYGFYVLTEGIDLSRFEKNPVMLSDHVNANKWVLGRWADWKKEGAQLTALPEFDTDDDEANKIAGKVERGFINGASVGLLFNHEDLAYVAGKIILTKSTLIEATICPVPSNPNALQLYLQGDENTPLSDAAFKTLCLSLNPTQPENLNLETDMKKILLGFGALLALGFKDAPKDGIDESEIEKRIMELSAKLDAAEKKATDLEAENKKLKDAAESANLSEGTTFLNAAAEAGKINKDEVAGYLSLYQTNPALVKASIEKIPVKATLSNQVNNPAAADTTNVKTEEDFMKLPLEAQLAFQAAHPEKYNQLFS